MPRLVYSLHFETERQPGALPDAPIIEFIVPLDGEGNSAGIRPVDKPRVVELRPGDSFEHGPTQKRYKLTAMSAYRAHQLADEMLGAGQVRRDGYLVAT
jgi:hypothetical protein